MILTHLVEFWEGFGAETASGTTVTFPLHHFVFHYGAGVDGSEVCDDNRERVKRRYKFERRYPTTGCPTIGVVRADFICNQPDPEIPILNFTDQSVGATSWMWDFNGEGSSTEKNPSFYFAVPAGETVDVVISLTINGGADTIVKICQVSSGQLTFYTLTWDQFETLTWDQFETLIWG